MVDKIVEMLQGLQKDVGELRTDVHQLSDKVDHLSTKNSSVVSKNETKTIAQSTNVNYERKLTQSEQEYINKLHEDGVIDENPAEQQYKKVMQKNESEELRINQYGEIIKDVEQSIPQAPPVTKAKSVPNAPKIHEKSIMERFFSWLAKDWPMKIGGLFVIAAVGWFVTYAAAVGWLSPAARVVLGYVFAVICIAFGSIRAEKEKTQGNVFLVIGIGAMLISTLAGLHFYIISHLIGLFIMLISVGFVTLVSLKQQNISLTSSMIFFGALIPLFFFSGITATTIFVYLFILTLGTLWIVSFTGWRGLTTLMLTVVGFYSITYIAIESNDKIETTANILIAFLFMLTFYVANIASILKLQATIIYDAMTALGIGILTLIWVLSFATRGQEVFLLLIYVVFFAVASYIISTKTSNKSLSVIYGGVTAMLFAVATALQFDGTVLTTAYLVEASAFILIVLYFANKKVSANMRLLLTTIYAIPVFLSLGAVIEIFNFLGRSYGGSLVNCMPELFTIFIVCVSAFSIAIGILRMTDIEQKENMLFFRIFAYLGGAFTLLLIWFITHLFMNSYDIATFVSLVIYTVVGVAFYIMGIRESYKPYMIVGGILFGIVVARVLFVEFWTMDIVMKIITSFVLGTLLISTAFIKKVKK